VARQCGGLVSAEQIAITEVDPVRRAITPSHVLPEPHPRRRRFGHGFGIALAVAVLAGTATGCSNYPPTEDVRPTVRTQGEVPTATDSEPPGDELVRVTGTVLEGNGQNCLLLVTGTTRYALVGGDPSLLAPDDVVTVTGTTNPATATGCTDGLPLTVSSVDPEA
jgi:hypothetical protein